MFLLDDVLLAPGKAAMVLFQELARKAQEEWLNDDTIKQELQQLYEMLEGGRISDKDFEAQECRLLERLEQIARIKFQDKWGTADTAAAPIVQSDVVVSALGSSPPISAPAFEPLLLPPAVDTPPAVVQPTFAPPAARVPPAPATFAPPTFSAPPPPPPAVTVPPATAPMAAPVAPPVAPAVAPPPPPCPSGPLTMGQIIDCAVRAMSILKMRVSSITSVMPEDDKWRVSVELVERRGIPDTNDVLGLYELRLDAAGNVLRYERTQMRRRCDFSR